MKIGESDPRRSLAPARLGRYVAVGICAGILYVLLDQHLDALPAQGELPLLVRRLHQLIDLVLPVLAGGLFGLALHYVQQRAADASRAARRADELSARLTRVERDQAVWVVVAATLHEIKNPLHVLGLLLVEVTELDADEQAARVDLLERMRHQLARVQKNVDALRGLSQRSAPRPEPVDLSLAVSDVANDLMQAAHVSDAVLSLSGERHVRVNADPTHLRIILENLLQNALEAAESSRRATVDVDISVSGQQARLVLSDNGPGVPAELRGDLFEPLATSKSRGLGLGLPIARALARAMGGDVALADGSTGGFVLSLPRGDA